MRNRNSKKSKFKRLLKAIFLTLLILLLLLVGFSIFLYYYFKPSEKVEWGITFSVPYAEQLGLDWKTVYEDMLNDFPIKNFRVMTYWDRVESEEGRFDLGETNYQLDRLKAHGAKAYLILGKKQPRWPECYLPNWAKSLSTDEVFEKEQIYIDKLVQEYKNNDVVEGFQIQNEPLFNFGPDCPPITQSRLRDEIAKLKVQTSKPILVTDTGELDFWYQSSHTGADILGVTMYHKVYNRFIGRTTYPYPGAYYRIKAGFVKLTGGSSRVFGVELQLEPWFIDGPFNVSSDEQLKLFSAKDIKKQFDKAKNSGFERHYLWGVEWWNWMKDKQGNPTPWQTVRRLLEQDIRQ